MLSTALAFLSSSGLTPYVIIGIVGGLGYLGKQASSLMAATTHSTKVGQVFDTLGTVGENIAEVLLAHPAATPADELAAVRSAAVAQGVAYAKANYPDYIKAIGISDDTLATRLNNMVSGVMNDVAAGSVAAELKSGGNAAGKALGASVAAAAAPIIALAPVVAAAPAALGAVESLVTGIGAAAATGQLETGAPAATVAG